jgi:hypothetical protein
MVASSDNGNNLLGVPPCPHITAEGLQARPGSIFCSLCVPPACPNAMCRGVILLAIFAPVLLTRDTKNMIGFNMVVNYGQARRCGQNVIALEWNMKTFLPHPLTLSNQKFGEMRKVFGAESVGFATGMSAFIRVQT